MRRQIINKRSGNPHLEMSEKCFIFEYLCACFKTLPHRSASFPTVFPNTPHTFLVAAAAFHHPLRRLLRHTAARIPLPTHGTVPLTPFSPPTHHPHSRRHHTHGPTHLISTPLSADHLFRAPPLTASPATNSALHRVATCRPSGTLSPLRTTPIYIRHHPLPFSHLPTPFTTARRGAKTIFFTAGFPHSPHAANLRFF